MKKCCAAAGGKRIKTEARETALQSVQEELLQAPKQRFPCSSRRSRYTYTLKPTEDPTLQQVDVL